MNSAEDEFVVRAERAVAEFENADAPGTYARCSFQRGKTRSIDVDIAEIVCAVDDVDTLFFKLGIVPRERRTAS